VAWRGGTALGQAAHVNPLIATRVWGFLAVAGLLAGCGGSSGSVATGASPSATPHLAVGTERPTARPSGTLPPEAAATQGGKYYAVFLAVAGDANDPSLADAQSRAKALGYQGGVGELNCTPGARTALNLENGNYTAYSIFFMTAEQAQTFVNAYSAHIVGTAYVTAGCLD
jgi:hypothetical protein